MSWKINRDPFYKELYEKGYKAVDVAGFFEDTAIEDVDISKTLNVLCTPLSFMSNAISIAKNPCIILTTGSFCPLHSGHIEMMEKSKSYLESIGYDVVGGYISPGHDEYISAKNAEKAIPIHYRIRTIVEMIKDRDWISVDPWEGLFCKVAVNFTDVYVRLEMYIKEHLKKDIPIFFVSGGDNARFAMTFYHRGHCIIVDRPGYDPRFDKYEKLLKNKKNIHFIPGGNSMSSTQLRVGAFVPDENKGLVLRVEDYATKENEHGLFDILSKYFSSIEKKEVLDQASDFYSKPCNVMIENVISLDSLLPAKYNLGISRSYDMFGARFLRFTNRPGTETFYEQLSKLEKGKDYTLFDDDIHTGNTMRYAKALVESSGSKVTEITSMSISSPVDSEILDCRDFFVTEHNNGLVIQLPNGKNVRAPYVYPYVCPFLRASIGDPMGFSIDVWKMNMNIFEKSSASLKEYPHFQDLFIQAGFKMEDSMYDICKWHHDLLVGFK